MAKPINPSLERFNTNTNTFSDRKVRRLMRKYKSDGYVVYQYLLCLIYGDKGYYLPYDDDLAFDIADHLDWIDEEKVNNIIEYCLNKKVNLFDAKMKEEYSILTSAGIQKRWQVIMSNLRRKASINSEFMLINVEDTNINVEDNVKNESLSPESKEIIHSTYVRKERKERMYREKVKILKVFYFRKFYSPEKEFEKFEKFYAGVNYERNGKEVTDWPAVAEFWKPETGMHGSTDQIMKKWAKVYKLYSEQHPDIERDDSLPLILHIRPVAVDDSDSKDVLILQLSPVLVKKFRQEYWDDFIVSVVSIFGDVKIKFQ